MCLLSASQTDRSEPSLTFYLFDQAISCLEQYDFMLLAQAHRAISLSSGAILNFSKGMESSANVIFTI
jgi:hypothetical protein